MNEKVKEELKTGLLETLTQSYESYRHAERRFFWFTNLYAAIISGVLVAAVSADIGNPFRNPSIMMFLLLIFIFVLSLIGLANILKQMVVAYFHARQVAALSAVLDIAIEESSPKALEAIENEPEGIERVLADPSVLMDITFSIDVLKGRSDTQENDELVETEDELIRDGGQNPGNINGGRKEDGGGGQQRPLADPLYRSNSNLLTSKRYMGTSLHMATFYAVISSITLGAISISVVPNWLSVLITISMFIVLFYFGWRYLTERRKEIQAHEKQIIAYFENIE